MRKKTSPLADRLDTLEISPEECAALCQVKIEDVAKWIEDGPDAEGKVRLRWLDIDADANRRVEQLRRTVRHDRRGAGVNYAGIAEDIPYANSDPAKPTGGAPS